MSRAGTSYVQWKICVPSVLAAEVELRLFDPLTGKPKYGARGDLIVELLRKHLNMPEDPAPEPSSEDGAL